MKKNRIRIKYVGAVAAALLAAAPIAATAVTAVSAPAFAATDVPAKTPSRDDLVAAVNQAQGELDQITSKVKQAEAAQETANAALAKAKDDAKEPQQKYDQAKAAEETTTVALTEVLDKQKPTIDQANADKKQATDTLTALNDAKGDAALALSQANKDVNTAQRAIDAQQVTINGLTDKINDPTTPSDQLPGLHEQLAAANDALNNTLKPALTTATEVQKNKQTALDNAARDYAQQQKGLNDKIAAANKKLDDAADAILPFQKAHNEAQQALQDATDALKPLGDIVKQMQANVDSIAADLKELNQKQTVAEMVLKGAQMNLADHDGKDQEARFALRDAINMGKALVSTHGSDYTDDSINMFKQALDAAYGLLNDAKAPIQQLIDAVTDLGKVADALVLKPTQPVTPPTTPTTPTTYPDPVFSFSDNFVKDPTIATGQSFDQNAGISAWTDSSKSTAIPSSNWQVSSSVDTNKPGTYTVTYTITNNYGKTATLTRTITVSALTESKTSGVIEVTNGSGAVLYTDNATSNGAGRTLAKGSSWKIYGVVKDAKGNIVAYNLGGKQYVKASDVAVSAATTEKGTFTVRYAANPKWAIAVYNSGLKVQKLISAGSRWQTFGTKTLSDGKSYFNLGGNQWVRTDYGTWSAK